MDVPTDAGKATLTCTVESPSGKKTPTKITDNGKGGFDVSYKPDDMGPRIKNNKTQQHWLKKKRKKKKKIEISSKIG